MIFLNLSISKVTRQVFRIELLEFRIETKKGELLCFLFYIFRQKRGKHFRYLIICSARENTVQKLCSCSLL